MHKIISKPSAIIFDFDDTLVNSKPIVNQALQATFKKFSIPEDIISIKNIDPNRSLRDYFCHIFTDNLKEAAEIYYDFYNQFSQNLEIIKNADKVLDFLLKNSVYTTIVSNKRSKKLREEISDKFLWNHYFKAIIGSGDAEEDKPSIKPALKALEDAKLNNFDEVWLIGDSLVDIQTAHNLGCKAILFGKAKLPDDIIPHLTIHNHDELLEFLRKIYV